LNLQKINIQSSGESPGGNKEGSLAGVSIGEQQTGGNTEFVKNLM